jgi:hypothetical protein
MKCTFKGLLRNNYPECCRLLHAVSLGKNLDNALLGRDNIWFDCAEVLEDEFTSEVMMKMQQNN